MPVPTTARVHTPAGDATNPIEILTGITAQDGNPVDRPVAALADGAGANQFMGVTADAEAVAMLKSIEAALQSILFALQHPITQDSLGRMRTLIEAAISLAVTVSSGSLTSVTTVGTVSAVTVVNELRIGALGGQLTLYGPITQDAWFNMAKFCIQ